jgi:SAM-dependent methyltransferase
MRTLRIRDLKFRRDELLPESRAALDRALARMALRERRARSLLGRIRSWFVPADWDKSDLDDFAEGRVLVVGCGSGLEVLALGATGIDLDPAALRVAADLRRHVEDPRGSVAAADGTRLPFADAAFDTVLSDNVVEHIPGPRLRTHFLEVLRVLRPGGRYAFHTPNRTWEDPPRDPDHVSLHTYAEWEALAADAGFVEPRTPRRRSGPLVPPDWKKDYERGAARGRRPMGSSLRGIRMVTLVLRKP